MSPQTVWKAQSAEFTERHTLIPPVQVITADSRTNLGPLTTTFTPEPDCNVLFQPCATCETASIGQSCVDNVPHDNPACWPPTSSGAQSPSSTMRGWGFYSPGLVCPDGYLSACTATWDGFSDWQVQFPMTAGETAVGCCPRGYDCDNFNGGTCTLVPTSTVVPIVTCRGDTTGPSAQETIQERGTPGFKFYAPMIQINWQASDRASTFELTQSTSGAATSDSTPSSEGPSQLGSGAIAGIVIGSVGGIGLLLIAFWLLKRHRRKKATGSSHQFHGSGGAQNNNTGSGKQFSAPINATNVYIQ